jgi:sporulation protein YlmC with PRC-barrel domain
MKKFKNIFVLATFLFLATALIFIRGEITGNVIANGTGFIYGDFVKVMLFMTAIVLVLFIAIHGKVIYDDSRKREHRSSLIGLIRRNVYTNDGDYIGRVKDVDLAHNMVDTLKIELDKGKKHKRISIWYGHVRAVGDVVFIDKGFKKHL